MNSNKLKTILLVAIVIALWYAAHCGYFGEKPQEMADSLKTVIMNKSTSHNSTPDYSSTDVEEDTYTGINTENTTFIQILNNGQAGFSDDDLSLPVAFEYYPELDSLGRCGTCIMNCCVETMPKDGEKRGSISSVTPSGWKCGSKSNNNKYSCVPGGYIYNRSHLLGWQLSSENANPRNLITGTRKMNDPGMLTYENKVANHIKSNRTHHIIYEVSPKFEGSELVARGVQMRAQCVDCSNLNFNVYIANIQDNIYIDYSDGTNYQIK